MSFTLNDAIALAATAHAGQVDKAGQPYILHCLRVMLQMDNEEDRIVAVLHDVVEDTKETFKSLLTRGVPTGLVQDIRTLTKRKGEPYDDYIGRTVIVGGRCARVKIADLTDNMDIDRFGEHVTIEDFERCIKYSCARLRIKKNMEDTHV